jgi:hypothetical protein
MFRSDVPRGEFLPDFQGSGEAMSNNDSDGQQKVSTNEVLYQLSYCGI